MRRDTHEYKLFNKIVKIMRDKYEVPRNYKTVGGMWTTDNYKTDCAAVQVMNEGWTIRLFNDELDVYDSGGEFYFEKGGFPELERLHIALTGAHLNK